MAVLHDNVDGVGIAHRLEVAGELCGATLFGSAPDRGGRTEAQSGNDENPSPAPCRVMHREFLDAGHLKSLNTDPILRDRGGATQRGLYQQIMRASRGTERGSLLP